MKKTYTKPEISFESFLMSSNIAANCEEKTSLPSQGMCGFPIDRTQYILFSSSATGCNLTKVPSQYDGLCYHVPSEDYNLFNS